MILNYNGQRLEAEKIIKTSDSIIGYEGNIQIFAFEGVKDFSRFTITGGEFTTELSESERITILEDAINMILLGGL